MNNTMHTSLTNQGNDLLVVLDRPVLNKDKFDKLLKFDKGTARRKDEGLGMKDVALRVLKWGWGALKYVSIQLGLALCGIAVGALLVVVYGALGGR